MAKKKKYNNGGSLNVDFSKALDFQDTSKMSSNKKFDLNGILGSINEAAPMANIVAQITNWGLSSLDETTYDRPMIQKDANPYKMSHGGTMPGSKSFKGASHEEGGIPVDANGQQSNNPIAEVEGDEFMHKFAFIPNKGNYIFSKKLGTADIAETIVDKYTKMKGHKNPTKDGLVKAAMEFELKNVADLNDMRKAIEQQAAQAEQASNQQVEQGVMRVGGILGKIGVSKKYDGGPLDLSPEALNYQGPDNYTGLLGRTELPDEYNSYTQGKSNMVIFDWMQDVQNLGKKGGYRPWQGNEYYNTTAHRSQLGLLNPVEKYLHRDEDKYDNTVNGEFNYFKMLGASNIQKLDPSAQNWNENKVPTAQNRAILPLSKSLKVPDYAGFQIPKSLTDMQDKTIADVSTDSSNRVLDFGKTIGVSDALRTATMIGDAFQTLRPAEKESPILADYSKMRGQMDNMSADLTAAKDAAVGAFNEGNQQIRDSSTSIQSYMTRRMGSTAQKADALAQIASKERELRNSIAGSKASMEGQIAGDDATRKYQNRVDNLQNKAAKEAYLQRLGNNMLGIAKALDEKQIAAMTIKEGNSMLKAVTENFDIVSHDDGSKSITFKASANKQ